MASQMILAMLAQSLGPTPRLREYADKLAEMGCDTPEMMRDLTEQALLKAGFAEMHAARIMTNVKPNFAAGPKVIESFLA